jgi:hypothetical protein
MAITFHNQWRNAEGSLVAIPHVTTKNISFLRTCQLLKKMGLKNYAFPLTLYDPDLADVDVHDLGEHTERNLWLRIKVQIEARINTWYYLRECLRIYEQGGEPVPFRLDRGSCAMTWCWLNGLDYTSMQPRQTGKTVCALALSSSIMFSSGEEYVVGMMAKDNDLRQENVKRVKAFGDNLPDWWLLKDKFKDKFNAEEIFYSKYRTHYQTFVAQKEKAAADKQGRGGSMPMVHWDEFEYINNIGTSYPTMMSSGSTARENAKKNGKPHSNIITTTAGDPLTQPCKEAAKLLEDAMPFTEQLYDVEDLEKLHELVQSRSPQKMILGVFSHLQLGYSNEWLRDRIRRGRLTDDQVRRDFLNQRVSISDKPIIPKHVLAMINQSQAEPNWIEILSDKFAIFWYVPREMVQSAGFRERSIVVGCDSSEMIGRDATTLIGVDPRNLETLFSFHCREGNIQKVGMMIADLLIRYPKMVWIPENKSSGTSLIDIVALLLRDRGQNPFLRIFNWIVHHRHEEEYTRFDIRDSRLLDTAAKKYFGIKTDKSKREELYRDVLIEGTERAQSRIKDATLITEMNSLTIRGGRVDHAIGGHDDNVVAWLLAMWLIMHGKHLDAYGIKPGSVLSLTSSADNKQRLLEEQQMKIRNRIDELERGAKRINDPLMRKTLEAEIRFMHTLIDTSVLPTPETADELSRDPRRFTDGVAAARARDPNLMQTMERSVRAIMGLS